MNLSNGRHWKPLLSSNRLSRACGPRGFIQKVKKVEFLYGTCQIRLLWFPVAKVPVKPASFINHKADMTKLLFFFHSTFTFCATLSLNRTNIRIRTVLAPHVTFHRIRNCDQTFGFYFFHHFCFVFFVQLSIYVIHCIFIFAPKILHMHS